MTESLARSLPYWALRTRTIGDFARTFLWLVDGTVVCGFEVVGVDTGAWANAQLNQLSVVLERALGHLPPNAFVQCEWRNDGSFDELVRRYEARSAGAPPLLARQKSLTARSLREDGTLTRGRLVYWLGLEKKLAELAEYAHGTGAPLSFLGLSRGPRTLDALRIQAVERELHELALAIASDFRAAGLELKPLGETGIAQEAFTAINPFTSASEMLVVPRPPAGMHWRPTAILSSLSLRDQLAFGDLVWDDDRFTLDDPPILHRALTLQSPPPSTWPTCTSSLLSAIGSHTRLVFTFKALDTQKLADRLKGRRNMANALSAGFVRNIEADTALMELESVLELIHAGDQHAFDLSVSAVVSGADEAELDAATREVREAFESTLAARVTTDRGRQLQAWLGALPAYGYRAKPTWTVLSSNVADLVPVFEPDPGDADKPQILFRGRTGGIRAMSFLTARRDSNFLVVASTGSGKSFTTSMVVEQCGLAENAPVLVVDVAGPRLSAWRGLTEVFGGSYVALSATDDIAFNPFFPVDQMVREGGDGASHLDGAKLRFLAELVCMMGVPGLKADKDRALYVEVARMAIISAYAKVLRSAKQRPPLLRDVVEALSAFEAREPEQERLARTLYLQLSTWIRDPRRAKLLDRPSSFASDASFQVFDFHGLEADPELAEILLFSVGFYIWSTLGRFPRELIKFVIFDECWKLLKNPSAQNLVEELFRTCRKHGASTWAITQGLSEIFASPAGEAIFQNSGTMLFLQHGDGHERVAEKCGFNPRQLELFKSLRMVPGQYSEMMLVDMVKRSADVVRLVPTPFDLWVNTSSAKDTGLRDRVRREKGLSLLGAIDFCAKYFPRGAPDEDNLELPA